MVARRRVFSSLYAYNTQRNVAVAAHVHICVLAVFGDEHRAASLTAFVCTGGHVECSHYPGNRDAGSVQYSVSET